MSAVHAWANLRASCSPAARRPDQLVLRRPCDHPSVRENDDATSIRCIETHDDITVTRKVLGKARVVRRQGRKSRAHQHHGIRMLLRRYFGVANTVCVDPRQISRQKCVSSTLTLNGCPPWSGQVVVECLGRCRGAAGYQIQARSSRLVPGCGAEGPLARRRSKRTSCGRPQTAPWAWAGSSPCCGPAIAIPVRTCPQRRTTTTATTALTSHRTGRYAIACPIGVQSKG